MKLRQIGIDVDVNRAIEAARLTLSETQNQILRRLLVRVESAATPGNSVEIKDRTVTQRQIIPRARGEWLAIFRDAEFYASNMKEAYLWLLVTLAREFPRFLEDFSKLGGSARRYVARSPEDLFIRSPHLVTEFSEKLIPGWWVDINLSKSQVEKRVADAAEILGLQILVDICVKEI